MGKIDQQGFSLLEMVCVIAIIALVAAVLLPMVPRQTSRARLQAYAMQAATLLKGDRSAAIRRGVDVATLVDPHARAIRAGASREMLQLPDDVRFNALLPQSCRQRAALSVISFFPDGMSCGGTIALSRLDTAYEIRVNWLTGRIEMNSRAPLAN
ncbi:MAG TPA: prepilin-type N-terminal cleavage/methylation domain-containing protein [Bradyrhizobium sp.]|nr:prepilin-type N-terminal cleavage/methylation domain-containing protein [Bradyrhizobium sp.]